jgi:hypothetical protein
MVLFLIQPGSSGQHGFWERHLCRPGRWAQPKEKRVCWNPFEIWIVCGCWELKRKCGNGLKTLKLAGLYAHISSFIAEKLDRFSRCARDIILASRYHLDMLRTKGRTKAIAPSTGSGSKKPRAFSAIHTDACFMIRSIPSTRIGSSCLV